MPLFRNRGLNDAFNRFVCGDAILFAGGDGSKMFGRCVWCVSYSMNGTDLDGYRAVAIFVGVKVRHAPHPINRTGERMFTLSGIIQVRIRGTGEPGLAGVVAGHAADSAEREDVRITLAHPKEAKANGLAHRVGLLEWNQLYFFTENVPHASGQ